MLGRVRSISSALSHADRSDTAGHRSKGRTVSLIVLARYHPKGLVGVMEFQASPCLTAFTAA
jgi:hypothetical protein